MKTKRKNEWYRRPKEEIVLEHLFSDGNKTISIIESIVGETPWREKPSEKVGKLIQFAQSIGLNYLTSYESFNQYQELKQKKNNSKNMPKRSFVGQYSMNAVNNNIYR